MKISSIAIMRWNEDTEDAVILDIAHNVAEYGFFQRGSVKEFLNFASKTLMKRLPEGVNCVDYEGNMCYCYVLREGVGAIAICDKDYPARVAVTLCKEQLAAFKAAYGFKWRDIKEDQGARFPQLEAVLGEYQDPAKVDKLMKLDRQLAETKDILYKTIDEVLKRGEHLDELVAKSTALSEQSKLFYKQAKKTNRCCVVM